MKTKLAFILPALICHTALTAERQRATPGSHPPQQSAGISVPKSGPEEDSFDFDDGTSLGRALRILANLAHLNYIEPELDPKETIALSLKGMSAREAFFELARVRGFTVKEQDGVVELIRTGAPARGNLIMRRYVLKNIDAHLVIQPVADFLGIKLVQPGTNSPAFPVSQVQDNLGSGNGYGGSSGMNNTSSSSSNGSGYGNLSSGNDITRSRFTPSFPMDAPFSEGGFDKRQNSLYIERGTNALVVRATEAQHEELAKYIVSHDVLEPQLVIEAQILEIDIERAKELGLDWNFSGGNGLGTTTAGVADGGLAASYGYTSGGAILSARQVSATLKALESKQCSTTVSNARVVTRSGIPALINNSVETPIEVSTVFGGDGTNTTAQTGTETFTTGVILDVLPRILGNGYIDLNINPTVATQVGSVKGSSGQDLPIISRRNATTSVVVKDGYTVGIGGLVQETNAKTRSQTPVLGRIPILGYLFQNFTHTAKRTNLVILVTPKIIRSPQFLDSPLSVEDQEALSKNGAAGELNKGKEGPKWPRAMRVGETDQR